MIFATYQDIFQSLDALPANEKYSDVNIQLKAMCRYFAGLYPKTDSLKNEEQNMAFLANVARSCLKTATKHPHIQDYYIKCFDMQFGSTAKEDEALSKRGVTRFPVTKKIPEVMHQNDFDDYNSLLLNKNPFNESTSMLFEEQKFSKPPYFISLIIETNFFKLSFIIILPFLSSTL